MIKTLYLTRNGLLEPLGQSQVMAYLRGLARDYAITLITYEKDEDRDDISRMETARAECDELGIRWLPQRFRPQPKLIAPTLSMLRMVWLLHREVRAGNVQMIHARSYIPAAVALIVSRMTKVPFIFDMRALWPEELITSGRIRRGSFLHRGMVAAERACLRRAAGTVSLTHAAVEYLLRTYPRDVKHQHLVVIPTCADLNRFVPSSSPPETMVIGCLGTMLSGWFRIDWLRAFLEVGHRRRPEMVIELTSRDNPHHLRAALGSELAGKLIIAPAHPQQVPNVLHRQFASVMFYAGGEVSELGRSPTRMAEILGTGLPVVANEGVGDVARIIREHRVGILVRSAEPRDMDAAWIELETLLADPDLALRCRKAAEDVFSLKSGTESYRQLYANILGGNASETGTPPCAG